MSNPTRRTFIKASAAAGATLPAVMPAMVKATSKNERVNIAFIGVNGIGNSHRGMAGNNKVTGKNGIDCPCFCDADESRMAAAKKQFPNAKTYTDYREMYDKEHKNFDAIMVGTPDHHHYPATIIGMTLGKHAYTQKPLTHTAWESRELLKAVKKYKVATQMGNQGHSFPGWRRTAAYIASDAIGEVKEVHSWTNRPDVYWEQGMGRPQGQDKAPANLDWNSWTGPSPKRPFKANTYHPFKWRAWQDFGGGALADMACHTQDSIFAILNPGHCTSVEVLATSKRNQETFPKSTIVKWAFPERNGRRAFDSYWYDGGLFPTLPKELDMTRKLPGTGNIYIGTKGALMVSGDYGNSPRLLNDAKHKSFGRPKEVIEKSPGHFEEWISAVKGDTPYDSPGSNFQYSAPMSETILLGNVALRYGRKLDWDGQNFKFTNLPEANKYLTKEYTRGWDFKA